MQHREAHTHLLSKSSEGAGSNGLPTQEAWPTFPYRPPIPRPTCRVTGLCSCCYSSFWLRLQESPMACCCHLNTRSQCEGPANPNHRHSLQPVTHLRWQEAGTMGPLMDTANLELNRLGHGNTSAALPSFMASKKRSNHWGTQCSSAWPVGGITPETAGSMG